MTYAIDDEHGTNLAEGLDCRSDAISVARTYFEANATAECVEVYSVPSCCERFEDNVTGESWVLDRAEVMS